MVVDERKSTCGMLALAASILFIFLIKIPVADAQNALTYTYDALGRLTSAVYPSGACTTYLYDAAGNRTQYTAGAATAPVAHNVAVTAYEALATTLDPRINDPSCAALTIAAVGTPSHGAAAISGGTITYTPAAGYTGADSFSYRVQNSVGSASGTVTVDVIAPTLAPIANTGLISYHHLVPPAVTPSGSVTIASVASDPYGYPLTVTGVTQGANGTVTNGGTFVGYVYKSSVDTNLLTNDAFTYTVSDGHGHSTTATVNVTINVYTNQ
jgi:YD repeat-containing protein